MQLIDWKDVSEMTYELWINIRPCLPAYLYMELRQLVCYVRLKDEW